MYFLNDKEYVGKWKMAYVSRKGTIQSCGSTMREEGVVCTQHTMCKYLGKDLKTLMSNATND